MIPFRPALVIVICAFLGACAGQLSAEKLSATWTTHPKPPAEPVI